MKLIAITIILVASFVLSGCTRKDKNEYYEACLDITDSMFAKNQFPSADEYQKARVRCKIAADDVYGK